MGNVRPSLNRLLQQEQQPPLIPNILLDSVLAIEYGYLERDGYRPGRTTYNITSLPSPALNNRTFNVAIGCIVGGSSAVNGQVFQRGTAGDYDLWGELGGGEESTWNWESMLTYFKKGIHFTPPKEDMAEAYNITYDLEYWGQDEDARIYATYTSGLEPGLSIANRMI